MRQGFTRAYGANLRQIIAAGTSNRFLSFFSGLGVTALLQSSTATALLAISFAKRHMLSLSCALAIMIGADISTTLVAQVLSLDFSWLSPLLLITGITIYLTSKNKNLRRHIGRSIIGLGLMLLALSLIRQSAAPLESSELLHLVLGPLKEDPFFAILVAAILTWVLHSSLAAVLLFASLASAGVFDLELGILFVLGANWGGAIVPFAVTFHDGAIARQISLGNILMRVVTLIIAFFFLSDVQSFISAQETDITRQIVNTHTAFNIGLAIIFLPLVSVVAFICERFVPEPKKRRSKKEPLYLDDKALDTPAIALASAARETLRIAEMVEKMLDKTIKAFEKDDKDLIKKIRRSDNQVDALYREVKLYMTRLSAESLNDKEGDRYIQILTFCTNLEHIGDIIDKSMMELAGKKIRKQESFSKKGFKEIKELHSQVLENFKLAQAIFISEDSELAATLVAGKKQVRKAADQSSEEHFRRLSEGQTDTIATSSLHLDIVRDYRRINSYATRVAYAILQTRQGTNRELPLE